CAQCTPRVDVAIRSSGRPAGRRKAMKAPTRIIEGISSAEIDHSEFGLTEDRGAARLGEAAVYLALEWYTYTRQDKKSAAGFGPFQTSLVALQQSYKMEEAKGSIPMSEQDVRGHYDRARVLYLKLREALEDLSAKGVPIANPKLPTLSVECRHCQHRALV